MKQITFFILIALPTIICAQPSVNSVTPAQFATDVARDSDLSISFSEAIDATTVNNTTIIISGKQTGLIAGTFTGGGTTSITFNPTADYKAGETITVTITTGIKNTGGTAMNAPYIFSFTAAVAPGPEEMPYFLPDTVSSTAVDAQWVHAADIDGDGDIDLLSASGNEFTSKIVWYENNGNQSFSTHDIASVDLSLPQSVYAADVDGDGDMDVLSALLGTNTIAWYENDGSQNFTAHTITTTANRAESVYAADVDGDGDMDVLSASRVDDTIAWYENDGSQNFTAHAITTTADGAQSVYAADLDSDGDLDVLSASESDDTIAWYENDGSQNFTAHAITTTASGAQSVFTADVDGDGDLDVLSASSLDDTIAWYENDGSQNFTAHAITTTADGARSVYAADVDGDGDIDVLSASESDDTIAWYENDGSQTFTTHKITTTANGVRSVYAADVDGDSDLDVLSASYSDGTIAWFENKKSPHAVTAVTPAANSIGISTDANITLTFVNPVDAATVSNSTVKVRSRYRGLLSGGFSVNTNTVTFDPAADFKAGETVTVTVTTGVQDTAGTAIVNPYTFTFTVAVAPGPEETPHFAPATVSTAADGASAVYAADVDGDGDMDLLSASFLDNTITWYENNGSQSFTVRTVTTAPDGTRTVYAADLDSDGDMDLLSDDDTNTVAWYENDGSQSFSTHIIPISVLDARSLFAADVNGDGTMDFLSAVNGSDRIYWHKNVENSYFSTRTVASVNGPRSVFAADVDSDGDLDVLSASYDDDTIYWHENDGGDDAGFSTHTITTTADGARTVYAADVDGDGDLDVLSASYNDDTIAWYENDGNQNFTAHAITVTADGAQSVFAADLDGDDDLDVLSASSLDDTIAWYENDGSQIFTSHTITSAADSAQSVYAADVDGDGDLDILSASYNDDTIAWYENTFGEPVAAGKSLLFDGTDDWVRIDGVSNVAAGANELTMSAWVRPAAAGQQTVLGFFTSAGADLNTITYSGNTFTYVDQITNAATGASFAAGQWYHVAITIDDNDNGVLFLNGTQEATFTTTVRPQADGRFAIAQDWDNDTPTDFFTGTIDEMRIWNTALSAEEIRQNMFQILEGDEAGLLAYYPMDGTSTTQLQDATANGNDGTLNGGVTRSDDTHPYGTFITGAEGWRIMSSPVDGTSYGTLLDPLWTQGFTGADSPTNGTSNVYTWDEAGQQFTSISNAADVPNDGTGFIVYVYDDQDYDGTPDGFPKMIQTDTLQNSGSISPVLSYTDTGTSSDDGWNLVGNPYGSTINWDVSTGWTKTNLDATIYVWSDSANSGSGDYLSWNGMTGTLPNGKIAPFQGFWVKANAASPSLALNDSVRSSGGVFFKKQPIPQIKFTLQRKTDSLSVLRSQTIVMLNAQADNGKDPLDAYKLQSLNSEYLSLFTTLPVSSGEDGTTLDINALPTELNKSVDIPMDYQLVISNKARSTSARLTWNLSAFPEDWQFLLTDTQTGQTMDLRGTSAYKFEVDTRTKSSPPREGIKGRVPQHGVMTPDVLKAKSTGSSRFTLTIIPGNAVSNEPDTELPAEVALAQNYPNPFNPITVIRYQLPVSSEVELKVFDILGREAASLVNGRQEAGSHEITFNARHLASGMYIYRLVAGSTVITKKLTLIK